MEMAGAVMDNIVVADKSTSEISANAWGNVQLSKASVVQLPVSPREVATVSRNGQDLTVTLKSGEHITVSNFFNTDPNGVGSDMVFQAEDGTLWQGQYSREAFAGFTFEEISSLDALLATTGVVGSATPEFAIAGLGLLGVGGAAAATGGGGGGGGGNNAGDVTPPTAPGNVTVSADGLTVRGIGEAGATINVRDTRGTLLGSTVVGADGTFTVPLNTPQVNGAPLVVDQTDTAGNVSPSTPITSPDTTAPAAPTNLAVAADGLTLTGSGEAGDTVTVRDANGNVLGSALVGADGTFTVPLSSSQTNGQTLSVGQTDPAGNASAQVPVTAADTTAPNGPTNLAVAADGLTLTGSGEAAATVTVRDANGNVLGTAVVGADGTFTVPLSSSQTNGQNLSVGQTDPAGNASAQVPVTAADTTPPAAPTSLAVGADGSTLTGAGEAGATVTVRDSNGNVLGSAVVAADGTFTVPLSTPQTNGQILSVGQTDPAGNASVQVPVTAVTDGDITPPAGPTNLAVGADGLSLTGSGEAGATVTVRDANGNVLGSAIVGADGTFTVPLSSSQTNGQTLSVGQTDPSGNASVQVPVTAGDTTAPAGPANLAVAADGSTLTGSGEAGATVTVRDANGNVLGSAVVAADGTFTVPLSSSQTNGQTLSVGQTDPAGNASAQVPVTAADTTAPGAPGALVFNADGSQLTGTAEPGATVQVRAADGTLLGTAIVAADGTFTLTFSPAQDAGQNLSVSAVDAAGNASGASAITAPDVGTTPPVDTTPPAAPTDVAISGNGAQLSGRGEAGATVTILDASGNILATGTVGADGLFNVPLAPAQIGGQSLTVTLTDAAGNVSDNVAVSAPDLSQPLAPENLAVSIDGLTLTGTGQPGLRIFVRNALGQVIGVGRVEADGTFAVTLDSAQVNGEVLDVNAVNDNGNSTAAVLVTAPDSTAPAPVTDLKVSPDGATLSGKGEAGDTVTVRDANGNALASATVAANGTFIITLAPPVAEGVVLTVSQADAAGNVSTATDVTVPDGSGPVAPVNPVLSADGIHVTGNATPGNTIEVRDANGNVLGSVVVAPNGTYDVSLTAPQLNGELLEVVAVAPNGAESVPTLLPAPDVTAPDQPVALAVNPNGLVVSGRGEPGATVTVKDAQGNVLGTAVVASTGSFAVTLPTAQIDGQSLQVTLTDAAGNTSAPLAVTAPDLDGLLTPSNISVDTAGTLLTGNGEAGSTITVTDSAGAVLGTAVVGANGTFSVTLNSPQNNGQTLQISAVDGTGNTAQVPYTTNDTQPPAAVTALAFDAAGNVLNGIGEPGATVTVRDANGLVLGTAVVNGDGTFSVALSTAQDNAESLQVVQADAAGNVSVAVTATAPDLTPPAALTNLGISANGAVVSGDGEVGATVKVVNSQGVLLGSAVVGANGHFDVTLTPAQVNGEALSVSQTDPAQNVSPVSPLDAPDIQAPDAPIILVRAADGITISGTGEAGATVTIRDANGIALGSAVTAADGSFTITLSSAQRNGQPLEISQADGVGQVSVVVAFNAIDNTPPATPTALQVSLNGGSLTGIGEAGSTVIVRGANNAQLGTAVVASDGTFSVFLSPPQLNGQQLSVSATDGTNVSPNVSLQAPDFSAPDAPSNLAVAANGTLLTGTAEPGTTVTVRGANGAVLGTAPVDANGDFSVPLSTPQLNGQTVSLVVTDAQGNASQPFSFPVPDVTAPVAVANLVISPDGHTVSGTGEAGTTVTITRGDGLVLGTGQINANGVFVVELTTDAVTADTLTVISTDGAGLNSPPVTLSGPDGTGLPAPTNLALSVDGFTLTGVGVAGTTVTVAGTGNAVLGSALVGSDGTFSVILGSAQLNGQILQVTASNGIVTSVPGTLTAGDTTAPDAPTNLLVSTDGSALSGRGEAGATVTVKNAAGAVIGSAVVDSNGLFSVALSPSQLNAETLTVRQTDLKLNESQPGSTIAPDLQSPLAPTGVSINAGGTVVTGQGEAGTTVNVRDAQGNLLATGTVDPSGNFQVTLPNAQLTGAPLQVQLVDGANHLSPVTSVLTLDRTPPAAVTDLTITGDGVTLAGHGEAGATVNVRDASGVLLGTTVVGATGLFSVNLSPVPNNGQTLEVTQTDPSGNVSAADSIIAPDISPPAALTDVVLNADGLTVTGHGEPGATVFVRSAGGLVLGSGLVDGSGAFSLTLNTIQNNAQILTVNQEDPPGNEGAAVTVIAPDFVAPVDPSALSLNASGLQLTGLGEARSTVTVTDAQGRVLGTAVVADNGTFQVTLNAPQLNSQVLSVKAADAAGNLSAAVPYTAADLTAPVPVSNLAVAPNGATLTGLGEAGATVSVTNALGVVIGTGNVASNGTFSVTLAPGVTAGDALSVVQTDAALNVSPATSVTAPGILAPSAPTGLVLSVDGLTVTGTAGAGTLVTVRSLSGAQLGTALAGVDGTFSVTLSAAQINGETLSVSASSSDGLNSLPTQLVANDTSPPAPITDYHLAANGITLTGRGEAGATVSVAGQGGVVLGTAVVAADGTFTVALTPAQTAGQVLSLEQTDAKGNESVAVNLTAPDLVAPLAATGVAVSASGLVVSGTGEAGATVTVKDVSGLVLGTGVVQVDGSFQVNLLSPQANGEKLAVTLTDASGNVSAAVQTSIDTTAPLALTGVAIAGDGATISGRGEAGATVIVRNSAGTSIGSVVVGDTGAFTLVLAVPLKNAEAITVTQTDPSLNVSPSIGLTAPDLTPPAPLAGVAINNAGVVVTGTGEPGATVTVRDPGGVVIGTTLVLANGSFSVTLNTPQINNQILQVQQADPPGNVSTSVPVTAPDLTPPGVPIELHISNDGLTVTGTGEAGTTVSITPLGGTSVGTGTVGADGHFSITLTAAQLNGQTLLVVLTDAANNASAAGTLPAPDTTPPAPVVLTPVTPIDATGSIVTGTGEPGARLVITNNLGDTVGTGLVASDGSFRVELTTPQRNGETLTVIQQDPTGNPSTGVTLIAPDITAPAAPVIVSLSANGVTLSGTGEAGATVHVYSSAIPPVQLGQMVVDADGTFSVSLNPPQLNGQVLNLVQEDAAGNDSGNLSYTVPDVQAPTLATGLTLSSNGLVVEGNGEVGASVKVLSGTTVIGIATVGADGHFSATLNPAQLNGGQLGVTLTDAKGNVLVTPASLLVPDVTAPDVPTVTAVTDTTVTGTAEANSFVTVFAGGVSVGTTQANGTGNYVVTLTTAQNAGQPLTVVARDAANNTSAPLSFNAHDSTPPGLVTQLTISADYAQLAGHGEAGATVSIRSGVTVLGTALVDANGNFTFTFGTPITTSTVLSIIQTDVAGNPSLPAPFTPPATPAPAAPAAVLSADGLTVSGTAAVGSTVTVYGNNGLPLNTGVALDGTYTILLPTAQTNGETLQVTASTTLGGNSLPTIVTALDTTPPAALLAPTINATGTLVTGTGEVGALVTIKSAAGEVLGTGSVTASGTFSVTLIPAQANGQVLTALQTDRAGAGLDSQPTAINAPDITPPPIATNLLLNGTGLQLSGAGEIGAAVTVRDGAGNLLGTGTVGAGGTFNITLSAAQLNGGTVNVTLTDGANNTSLPASLTVLDTTAPNAPGNLALSSDGLQLTGTGEAGARVVVTDNLGNPLGNALVGANGVFTVQLTAAQLNGETLTVRQTDAATNVSAPGTLVVADITAPLIASNLSVAANGTTVSGQGEAGTTAKVYGASGELLGSAQVGSNGLFTVTLTPAQADGQALTVRLNDGSNNVSPSLGITAPDITAPVAPATGIVNASGTLVTGSGIVGDQIVVRSANGTLLGSAIVAADGTYSVSIPAQINNQVLSITQLDAALNVSAPINATAPDLTPPPAAGALLVSADGLTLTGTAEAGSIVTVKNAAGTTIGTGTAAGDGTFTLTLNTAQINGEVLKVTLADIKGNVSPSTNVTAPDIDVNLPVIASDNLATATVTLTPATTVRNYADSFLTVLGLGTQTKAFAFTVNSGETAHSTLTLTTGNILELASNATYTLQVKDATGAWVSIGVAGNGAPINLALLGGTGLVIDMGTLIAGDYRLVAATTSLTLLQVVNSNLHMDVTSLTQFNGVAGAAVTGNVITDIGTDGTRDITGPDNGAVLQVLKAGAFVNASAGTTVQGLYGTLTIDGQGNYSYTPNGNAASVGKVDVFTYQLVHGNGLSDSATLYVRIDSPQAVEVWSNSNLAAPAVVVDATNDVATTDVTLVHPVTHDVSTLGTAGAVLGSISGAYTFSVLANTVSDLTLTVQPVSLLNLLPTLTLGLYKLDTTTGNYVLVKSWAGNSLLTLGGGTYGVTVEDQTPGTYRVNVSVTGVALLNTVTVGLINDATVTNLNVIGSSTPVSGNLFTDTAGAGPDVLGSPFTSLAVLASGAYVLPGYNGTSVVGTYGTLLVKADGSYSYALKAGLTDAAVGHTDTFTYQLTHPNGTTDTATLTIDLHQAGTSAVASVAAFSLVDDSATTAALTTQEAINNHVVIQGSDGNDELNVAHAGGAITLNGGAGNDTLIVVDQHFASVDGGTGTDTLLWAGGDASIDLGNLQGRLHNIEVIDLNATSAVKLTLNLSDLVAVTEADHSTLLIKGTQQDSVHMTGEWSADGTHLAAGLEYTQYTPQEDPTHHLWVQNGVQVV
jgi:VCBS repeat-containing protein